MCPHALRYDNAISPRFTNEPSNPLILSPLYDLRTGDELADRQRGSEPAWAAAVGGWDERSAGVNRTAFSVTFWIMLRARGEGEGGHGARSLSLRLFVSLSFSLDRRKPHHNGSVRWRERGGGGSTQPTNRASERPPHP